MNRSDSETLESGDPPAEGITISGALMGKDRGGIEMGVLPKAVLAYGRAELGAV